MNADLLRRAAALPAAFRLKFNPAPDGCWIWAAALSTGGYGRYWTDRRFVQAHRFSCEALRHPISPGLVIDHLCRNRACVNPWHLEPVTPAENARRGARGRLVTECVNGHAYTPENTYIKPNGCRNCRTCRTERKRRCRA